MDWFFSEFEPVRVEQLPNYELRLLLAELLTELKLQAEKREVRIGEEKPRTEFRFTRTDQ